MGVGTFGRGEFGISGEDAELNLKKGIAWGDLNDLLKGANNY